MYFKLLHRSGHVNQVRCIDSVSAWNSSAKTFASTLAFAVYCHSQKDNCDTLYQARHQARSPPPLWLFITPSYQLCVANSWNVQTTLSVLQGAHAIKSIDAVCHWVQVKKKHTKWNFVSKFGVDLELTNLILPPSWNFRYSLLSLLQCHNSSTSCLHYTLLTKLWEFFSPSRVLFYSICQEIPMCSASECISS